MTFQNKKVLEFYKILPFNIYGNLDNAEKQIKKFNPADLYPELRNIISKHKKIRIIDFGCGGGWLVNSLAYHFSDKIYVTGVDFNPVAIKYANTLKKRLNLNSRFFTSDLFQFENKNKFDVIISLGVLHHTNNCREGIKHIIKFGEQNSYLFIGLYHLYGRKPFLNFFEKIKHKSEKEKFEEYKKLHRIKDEKKIYSWFRDQVLHPHETQHTLKEIKSILDGENCRIISTSINNFKKIDNFNKLIELEKKLEDYGIIKLKKKEYFPGFFITIAQIN